MQEKAICPHCGTELEYVETLDRFPKFETMFRVDLENRHCPVCKKGFDVEAYYLYPPVFFGSVKEWED